MKSGKNGVMATVIAMLAVLLTALTPVAGFCEYPEKTVTIVHGWGPGGMLDILSRILADGASKILKQPLIVEPKPGGGQGQIALNFITRAKPDGYTIAAGITSQLITAPVMEKMNFDPVNDVTQIMVFAEYDLVMVVRPDSPWKTWEDLRDFAKRNPGKVSYGSTGAGAMQHLIMEMIGQKEGITWNHVPFRSGKDAIVNVLGKHLDVGIQGPSDVIAHLKAGELRYILGFNDRRWPFAPDVPTTKEKGYETTFSLISMYGPKGLPEAIRLRLESAFREAMKDPKFDDTMRKLQITSIFMPGKEYTQMLRERGPKFKKIIQDLGLVAK